jgi:myo-inositol-1(or 4)-monophosphatase
MDTQNYLNTAVSAAKEFGKIFVKNFGKAQHIKIKGNNPHDLVTEIDQKIEQNFRKLIAIKFPDHKVIGEEYGEDNITSEDLVWIIDPIDGTTNYIQGIPFACISIALWKGNTPLVGVVYCPVLNQLFTAQKGKGAFLNGKKISTSKLAKFELAFTAFCWGRNTKKAAENFPKLVTKLHKIRTFGATALEICFVASGQLDSLISYEAKIWDFAAGAIILQEAGGNITEYEGSELTLKTNSLLATNGKIHKVFLTKLQELK